MVIVHNRQKFENLLDVADVINVGVRYLPKLSLLSDAHPPEDDAKVGHDLAQR